MKRILFTFTLIIALLPLLHAQQSSGFTFRGTTWKGVFNVPDPLDCLMEFKKDTALLLYVGSAPITSMADGRMVTGKDSAALEVMTYVEHLDTVTFYKVSGGSPCGKEPGVYVGQRSNGKMRLIPVGDDCEARKGAMAIEMAPVR